jgi:hypothetical protein
MQKTCIWAYPNPKREMGFQIKCIVPHSNRIAAPVALTLGGASDKEIAFCLCWLVGSVPRYLRECFLQVDTVIQQALKGAHCTSL